MQLGYDYIFLLGSQTALNYYLQDLNAYSGLIPASCLPVFWDFLCQIAFPKCVELPSAVDPKVVVFQPMCRHTCEFFASDCSSQLSDFVITLLPVALQEYLLNCSAVYPGINDDIFPPLYQPWTFPANPGIFVYCEGRIPPPPLPPIPPVRPPKASVPKTCQPYPLSRGKIGFQSWVC